MIRHAVRALTGHLYRGEPLVLLGEGAGFPRVSVDLDTNNGTRTYEDAAKLRQFGLELLEAATWLYAKQQEGNRK